MSRCIYTDDDVDVLAREASGVRSMVDEAVPVEDEVRACVYCGTALDDEARCSACGGHQ